MNANKFFWTKNVYKYIQGSNEQTIATIAENIMQ